MADSKMYEKNGNGGGIDTVEKLSNRPENLEQVDLNNNVAAKLRNPLSGIPREALMAQVEDFARQRDLEHALPMLKKGALLAQSPVSPHVPRCFLNLPKHNFYRTSRETTKPCLN